MDTQKLKQDHGNVRWDGPRLTGIAPDFAPQEIDSPLFATNMTPSNADELVRRWNAYPSMLAALQTAVDALSPARNDDEATTIEQARAAITNAINTH